MKMKIRHISDLKYIAGGIPALAAGVLLVLSAGFSSCSEQIEIEGNLDASSIENATAVHGFLNVLDNPRLKVTEVRTEPVTLQLQAALTNKYDGIAYFTIEAAVDDDLVAQYNTQHGTDFPVLPAANVTIEDNGKIAIAPGDKVSYTFNMTVSPEDLAEGTYVLPVRTVSQTGDVTVTEKDAVKYLLFSMLGELPSTAKSSGIISIAYIEVNGFNPLNAGEWTLASSGTQFFDIVNIFAANINWIEEEKRVGVVLNPNVRHILDNRDKYIKPLQDAGMRVSLTILGNGDGSGECSKSEDIGRNKRYDQSRQCPDDGIEQLEESRDESVMDQIGCAEHGERYAEQSPDERSQKTHLDRVHKRLPYTWHVCPVRREHVPQYDKEITYSPDKRRKAESCDLSRNDRRDNEEDKHKRKSRTLLCHLMSIAQGVCYRFEQPVIQTHGIIPSHRFPHRQEKGPSGQPVMKVHRRRPCPLLCR